MAKAPSHTYTFSVYNGRYSVSIDGHLAISFNQLDYKGMWAYKDDTSLYGIDIYLSSLPYPIELHFKTKGVWLEVLTLLKENL